MSELINIDPIQKETPDQINKAREENNKKHYFYKAIYKDGVLAKVSFQKAEFLNLLQSYNIFCFDLDLNTTKFIEISDGTIKELSEKQIQRIVGKHILALPDYEEILVSLDDYEKSTSEEKASMIRRRTAKLIYDTYLNNLENLFNRRLLFMAHPGTDILFAEDTKTSKFLFFKNGFIKVTANDAKLKPYSELKGRYIWADQKLNRDYTQPPDNSPGMFEKMVYRVCGLLKENDKHYAEFNEEVYLDRLQSFKTILGYLLHHFTRGKLYAIIFTDAKLSDEGEANGRSGKTLISKALGWMLNTSEKATVYCEISGRKFDVRDKHKYDRCNLDTKLIHLNDLYNNFNIEHLFTDISEGVEAKKLYEQPFTINPKFLLSSNKQIKIIGESARDRVTIFEFSDYYNANRSPLTEFGCWFFDEWDLLEWDKFSQFMISCLQTYLKMGLQQAKAINLKVKMVQDHTNRDFVGWIETKFKELDEDGNTNFGWIRFNKPETDKRHAFKYCKKSLYNEFNENYPDYQKKPWFDQRKLTGWLKFYVKTVYPNMETHEYRGKDNDYIYFNEKGEE